MNKKELLKENCTYKLFLINLIDNFEEVQQKIEDKNLKQYFKELESAISNLLGLKNKCKDFDSISKIFKQIEDNNEL